MTLDYATAALLKKAGFPQKTSGDFRWYIGKQQVKSQISTQAYGLYFPTLEELVEECKKPITIYIDDHGADAEQAGTEICGSGPTPIAAVAALYLSLHPLPEEPVR